MASMSTSLVMAALCILAGGVVTSWALECTPDAAVQCETEVLLKHHTSFYYLLNYNVTELCRILTPDSATQLFREAHECMERYLGQCTQLRHYDYHRLKGNLETMAHSLENSCNMEIGVQCMGEVMQCVTRQFQAAHLTYNDEFQAVNFFQQRDVEYFCSTLYEPYAAAYEATFECWERLPASCGIDLSAPVGYKLTLSQSTANSIYEKTLACHQGCHNLHEQLNAMVDCRWTPILTNMYSTGIYTVRNGGGNHSTAEYCRATQTASDCFTSLARSCPYIAKILHSSFSYSEINPTFAKIAEVLDFCPDSNYANLQDAIVQASQYSSRLKPEKSLTTVAIIGIVVGLVLLLAVVAGVACLVVKGVPAGCKQTLGAVKDRVVGSVQFQHKDLNLTNSMEA